MAGANKTDRPSTKGGGHQTRARTARMTSVLTNTNIDDNKKGNNGDGGRGNNNNNDDANISNQQAKEQPANRNSNNSNAEEKTNDNDNDDEQSKKEDNDRFNENRINLTITSNKDKDGDKINNIDVDNSNEEDSENKNVSNKDGPSSEKLHDDLNDTDEREEVTDQSASLVLTELFGKDPTFKERFDKYCRSNLPIHGETLDDKPTASEMRISKRK
jgi:hypothetical protein